MPVSVEGELTPPSVFSAGTSEGALCSSEAESPVPDEPPASDAPTVPLSVLVVGASGAACRGVVVPLLENCDAWSSGSAWRPEAVTSGKGELSADAFDGAGAFNSGIWVAAVARAPVDSAA